MISMCVFGVLQHYKPHYSVNLCLCVYFYCSYLCTFLLFVLLLCIHAYFYVCLVSSMPWTSLLSEFAYVCVFVVVTHVHS